MALLVLVSGAILLILRNTQILKACSKIKRQVLIQSKFKNQFWEIQIEYRMR